MLFCNRQGEGHMGSAASIIGLVGFLAMTVGAFVAVLYDQSIGGIIAISGFAAAAFGFFIPLIS
jgi:hypothetical protein